MEKMKKMYTKMQSMLKNKKGATMVEYALMIALIAIVAAVGAKTLGGNINTQFGAVATKVATP